MPDKKPKPKLTFHKKKMSKPATALRAESKNELRNYHMSETGKYLRLDTAKKSASDKVLRAMDISTTDEKRRNAFYGNKPPEGVSQKVFDAFKAVGRKPIKK